ncbi:MAG: hypothetical protein U5Q44_12965 [Dehalococcoidia bacterium]|nr:hypothetical protein [Dehalococcoidia bacterium]
MAIQDRAKSVAGHTRNVAGNVGTTARRQARRAQLELENRRLQRRINREHAEIGRALLPKVESGELGADNPEIQHALTTLRGLRATREANREELEKLGGAMPVGEPAFDYEDDEQQ